MQSHELKFLTSVYKQRFVHECEYFKRCKKQTDLQPQELEVRSLYHLYSLKTKISRHHYIVMTRKETKLLVTIPAPVSGQSAVNVATATSKCSITFLLPYDQDGDVKTKQDNVSNIL